MDIYFYVRFFGLTCTSAKLMSVSRMNERSHITPGSRRPILVIVGASTRYPDISASSTAEAKGKRGYGDAILPRLTAGPRGIT